MTPADRLPVIGLCGGIGAGKSAVAEILAELGCVVSDSDREAAEVLAEPDVVETLRSWWGDDVLDSNGRPNRAAVAGRVFGDPEERARLERLVHPRIHARRAARFASVPPDTVALVIDAPLLFEAGLDRECDAVLFVEATRESRLERVRTGRGWSESELARREAAQLPPEEKRERAGRIVRNDGDRTMLFEEVKSVLASIVAG